MTAGSLADAALPPPRVRPPGTPGSPVDGVEEGHLAADHFLHSRPIDTEAGERIKLFPELLCRG